MLVKNLPAGVAVVSFTVNGYQSPSTNSSSFFELTSYDSNGNPIDTVNTSDPSSQLQFIPTCQSGCKTCQDNNHSACTSCYNASLDNRTLFNAFTQRCVSICESGYYANNTVCLQCVQNCWECNSVTGCTLCATGYNLYSAGCVAECPQAYFAINGSCVACSNTCLNCSMVSINCTSCPNGFELNLTNSSGSCSPCSTTAKPYYNSDSRVCVECEPPCSRCSGSVCL